jgi:hypothetical protein
LISRQRIDLLADGGDIEGSDHPDLGSRVSGLLLRGRVGHGFQCAVAKPEHVTFRQRFSRSRSRTWPSRLWSSARLASASPNFIPLLPIEVAVVGYRWAMATLA